MCQPFIRNHQFNWIQKQTGYLQNACATVADKKVVQSVRDGVLDAFDQAFPEATEDQRQLLGAIEGLHAAPEFQQFLQSLEPCREPFEALTEKQIAKLYPKVKKLKVPDLVETDWRKVTYVGWTDAGSGKLYLVYRLEDRLIGIEGRFTPTNKKGSCFLCNRQEEIGLFTAVTKKRPAQASPDYYKAVGQYICADSAACNRNVTDVAALERFVREIVG